MAVLDVLMKLAYSEHSVNTNANLRVAAYAAMGTLIERASTDSATSAVIKARVDNFVSMLRNTLTTPGFEDSQIFLCSAL
jgi:cell division ATPase FtsA